MVALVKSLSVAALRRIAAWRINVRTGSQSSEVGLTIPVIRRFVESIHGHQWGLCVHIEPKRVTVFSDWVAQSASDDVPCRVLAFALWQSLYCTLATSTRPNDCQRRATWETKKARAQLYWNLLCLLYMLWHQTVQQQVNRKFYDLVFPVSVIATKGLMSVHNINLIQ